MHAGALGVNEAVPAPIAQVQPGVLAENAAQMDSGLKAGANCIPAAPTCSDACGSLEARPAQHPTMHESGASCQHLAAPADDGPQGAASQPSRRSRPRSRRRAAMEDTATLEPPVARPHTGRYDIDNMIVCRRSCSTGSPGRYTLSHSDMSLRPCSGRRNEQHGPAEAEAPPNNEGFKLTTCNATCKSMQPANCLLHA